MSSSLGIAVIGRLLWVVFGVTWLILLHRWVHMVVVAFGADRGVNFPFAVITIFTVTGLGVAPAPSFWLFSEGFILRCVLSVAVVLLRRVHHVYISYDEVAVQRPVGGGSKSSPAPTSIPSVLSESKSSMSVTSSTVAIKWVVGGL